MKNKYGLSKKTNIVIASIAGLGVVKEWPLAILAVAVITLVAVVCQWNIDRNGN